MGLLDILFGRQRRPSPSDVARERLKLVLVHDRCKVTPDLLEQIKEDLLSVISRRLEIDEQKIQVSVTHGAGFDKLIADVPIKRPRVDFERDEPKTLAAKARASASEYAGRQDQPGTIRVPKSPNTRHAPTNKPNMARSRKSGSSTGMSRHANGNG